MIRKQNRFLLAFVVLILLNGCIYDARSSTDTPPSSATPSLLTAIGIIPSATFLPAPTFTQIPLILTPLPKLNPNEAVERVIELLSDNGGCRLPCIWGITPGGTVQREVKNIFDQFGTSDDPKIDVSKVSDNDGQGIGFFITDTNIYINIGIWAQGKEDMVESIIVESNTQPKAWDPSYPKVMKYYTLSQILTEYGKPSQVLLLTFRDDPQRPDISSWPFYLTLVYPEKGFFLQYKMKREEREGEFLGCPSNGYIYVATWDPETRSIYESLRQQGVFGTYLYDHKSIEAATSLSLEEFYVRFRKSDEKACVQTPIERWPIP